MTSRNRERNSVHDRTHTHLRALQEGQTHQGASVGELLNDIKTNTSNINLNVDSLEVNTDTLETKIQTTNDKIDTLSGAGNNNIGEGQVKLQIYNYGRDVAAGNYKPMVVDSDGHLQVDSLSSALPTGAATEAKQDTMNTKLDTISGQLVDDNKSVANGVNAVNTNVITQNTNFHNKVAFIQASVDAESSPPSASTEILLTEDVPMLFKMTALTTAVGGVETAITTNTGTLNSTLTTIDTDTGNIDTKLGVLNTTTSANNTIQAGILNGLSGNNSGGGTFAGENLQTIADRLFDDNKSVANGVNAINTNTISNNTKLTSIDDLALTRNLKIDLTNTKLDTLETTLTAIETDAAALETLQTSTNTKLDTLETTLTAIETDAAALETLQTSTNTKLDTIASRLIDDSNSVATSNNAINTNTITTNSKLDTITTKLNGGLPSELESGQLKVHDDDTKTQLISANTKLDTLETTLTAIETDVAANEVLLTSVNNRLFDDNKSVANAVNSVNTNTIANTGKLDDINFNLAANNLLLSGGLPSALNSDQLKVSDSSALTKLGTIDTTLTAIETNVGSNGTLLTSINSRLFDDNKSVANAVNSVNTNIITTNSKLDSLITLLTSLDTKLSASNTSGHYGNS